MNIIVVDDERRALHLLQDAVNEATNDKNVEAFLSPIEALKYAKENRVDVAFLDINMGEMNGLILAKHLKEIRGSINIIFVTSYSEFAPKAFQIHASGYLLKPVDTEQVICELHNLRNKIVEPDIGLRVQCFGNFEVFMNGKPVHFGRSGSKEIFAYLIDRQGARVNRKNLAAVLWEDDAYDRRKQKQLQTLIDEMKRSLKNVGADESVVIHKKGYLSIDASKLECDFYDFVKWGSHAVNSYRGEYMSNYSWAEFTTGMLNQSIE